jgi:hypothetical protein
MAFRATNRNAARESKKAETIAQWDVMERSAKGLPFPPKATKNVLIGALDGGIPLLDSHQDI